MILPIGTIAGNFIKAYEAQKLFPKYHPAGTIETAAKYDCIKIFFTGEEQSPDFNIADYAVGYDDIRFGDR